jgi:hypothetical protein
MILLVREEDAEAATRLIAEQRQAFSGQSFSTQSSSGQSSSAESALDDDTTSEIAIIEEPPPKG